MKNLFKRFMRIWEAIPTKRQNLVKGEIALWSFVVLMIALDFYWVLLLIPAYYAYGIYKLTK